VSKVVLGILTGILIFIAAGILATYWVAKMRREMEQKRPQVAITVGRRA
jgi:predicted Na+-dependent transporter